MGFLEDFETAHLRELAELGREPFDEVSFCTPDGREWRLSEVLRGSRTRPSDRWGLETLHGWIARGFVDVWHVGLPCELVSASSPDDPARRYVERVYGPLEERPRAFVGECDFAGRGAGDALLLVEVGDVSPAKFALNVGKMRCDHMVVPFASYYAFVFQPRGVVDFPIDLGEGASPAPVVR